VAIGASPRKPAGGMVRVRRPFVVHGVTTIAIRRRPREAPAHMARIARRLAVCSRQRKLCEAGVVELRPRPTIGVVALYAICRDPRRHMVEASGILIVAQMAARASRVQPHERSRGRPFVAGFTSHRCVRSQQREAIAMISKRFNLVRPAENRMTGFAPISKLLLMYVCVAVSAITSHVPKFQAGVAPCARHVGVHPSQRKSGCRVMVELRKSPDGLPTHRRVAILAGKLQSSVRTARSRRGRCLSRKRYAEC
jgi:hypothetical protein